MSEDKLIGPFFFGEDVVPLDSDIVREKFIKAFKDKLIMYLFEDAAKQKVATLFKGCLKQNEEIKLRYSEICDLFDTKGIGIFCDAISKKFNELPVRNSSEQNQHEPVLNNEFNIGSDSEMPDSVNSEELNADTE